MDKDLRELQMLRLDLMVTFMLCPSGRVKYLELFQEPLRSAPTPLSFPEGEQVPPVDENEQTDLDAEEDDGENAGESSGGEEEDGSDGASNGGDDLFG